jgi:hypothetical protein
MSSFDVYKRPYPLGTTRTIASFVGFCFSVPTVPDTSKIKPELPSYQEHARTLRALAAAPWGK